ncbi:hypothetical protein HU200_009233 [Digitaria exilis]|uniref:F-box/LRR-repeat protein n=1 Tax=Digitaria exilis TaxID=1010633 RepID=A0A835KPK4_9POAL|nr:hypothetical protein HU200_009233 [Digitaria exilis]
MRLDLVGVYINSRLCDFSSCPFLEHLEIDACYCWSGVNISSKSLKHLALKYCDFGAEFRALLHVPSLVSLTLDGHLSSAPVLGCMPSLQEAFVRVTHENVRFRDPDDYLWSFGCDYDHCYSCDGIIRAENLALLSQSKSFVFGRDLKQCPTFSKLKNLLLDEHWCVAPVFPALTCILKHSPVLEKLTLQLFSKGPHHKMEMIGRCSSMNRSVAISEHLKAIEIKCEVVDQEVHKVLRFLCSLIYVSKLVTLLMLSIFPYFSFISLVWKQETSKS